MVFRFLPILFFASTLCAQSGAIQLIDPAQPKGGWRFDNGREFPGAKGSLELDSENFQGQPVLVLNGNFTGGGNYVQTLINLPSAPVDTFSFWINIPAGTNTLPVRLGDGSGQTHQLRLKLNDKGGWQKIVVPVDEYFGKMGTADALDITSQYQNWGGAKDARWHQPGKYFAVICGKGLGLEPTVKLSGVELTPATPKEEVAQTIRLDDLVPEGETSWELNMGREYKGAKGGMEVIASEGVPGGHAMEMRADFTGGGAYIGIRKKSGLANVQRLSAIRFRVKSSDTRQFSMRMVDGGKQTHQRKGIKVQSNGQWQEIAFTPGEFSGQEHWGGANDGKWRGGVSTIEIMLNTRSNPEKKATLQISDIRAEVVVQATKLQGMDLPLESDNGWSTSGDVGISGKLQLSRKLEALQTRTHAISPSFPLEPGSWQATISAESQLHSPDNSYHAKLGLDVADASGQTIETIPLGIFFGDRKNQASKPTFTLPPNAASGSLSTGLHKTYGTFTLESFSLSRLQVQPLENRVGRILIRTEAVGNLFYPGDDVQFEITVEANKPLPKGAALSYSIKDYWGTLQLPKKELPLTKLVRKDGKFPYHAEFGVDARQLQAGKFYQLHIEIAQPRGEPAKEFSGFAILPKARNKRFQPSEIPFTVRNWDGRIPAYFYLADRLGIRTLGVWGGWKSKPPYKPHLPGLERCAELDMDWITGTPAAQIERNGFKEYSEESLRQGMKNFLEEYADTGLAKIAMGNEPHGTGEKVLENIRAYKAIYETVKAFDPDIHVMGTSVEPNDEYFRNGYQNYLDSYDFHIYEHYTRVRKQMREYRALMEKYNAVKPIHSTELGLNSQGQTRLDVSREMIKKLTSFFAEGGEMVAWFTIQYPDPKGKARGQFGDSHCMFDCKYNLYNPRLDAITHYHYINAVSDKKFIDEKHYPSGIQAYLFQDKQGQCLQALWLDAGRKDVRVPLPDGTKSALLTYIDGTSQLLANPGGGITLTVSDDPILLSYHAHSTPILPESLGKPGITVGSQSIHARPGQPTAIAFTTPPHNGTLPVLLPPPMWSASVSPSQDSEPMKLSITPPESITARTTLLRVQETSGKAIIGEILVPVRIK